MKFPYDTDYWPPAPSLEIRLAAPDESFKVGPLPALVDTGADASIIPVHHISSLQLQADDRKYLRSQWGEHRMVDIYFLDVGIGDLRFPFVEIIADVLGDELILGRNVLNKLKMTLDGPNQQLEI